jgi:CRISPR-associated exonuclease Cas4
MCERQWALIHIEKQWQENLLTTQGHFLHEKTDNAFIKEKRSDLIIARSISVVSYTLGLYGVLDVLEFTKSSSSENCLKIPHKSGYWRPNIVEYKRGKPKHVACDKVQLCAQAICMEEMHHLRITDGNIFYNQTKHRESVAFDEELRTLTMQMARKMHQLYQAGMTPAAAYQSACKSCSLHEVCLPKLSHVNVAEYLRECQL